jgi:ABC-type glycerol-3-phosphate transport system substrate-binding protein
MRKSCVFSFSLLIVLALALAACGAAPAPEPAVEEPAQEEAAAEQPAAEEPAEEAAAEEPAAAEETVLTVWSFTNEINTMAVAYEGQNPDVDIQYTMIPMTQGEYQTKLKAALGTADAPDVIALEAAFVKELVEADILEDLGEFLPIAEENQTYPFVIDVGTNELAPTMA